MNPPRLGRFLGGEVRRALGLAIGRRRTTVLEVGKRVYNPLNHTLCRQEGPSMAAQTAELTQLLRSWSEGNKNALDQLVPLVHAELHRLARGCMRGERQGSCIAGDRTG